MSKSLELEVPANQAELAQKMLGLELQAELHEKNGKLIVSVALPRGSMIQI
jgi:hypothetical protein